jgi:molybdenum cofactor synthesis domain-containing protein
VENPSVEVFAIGTELAFGQIQDTNSSWIAQQVVRLGGKPRRLTVLNDNLEDMESALRDAVSRGTRILLLTGGLGPTPDDLTVDVVCRLTGRSSVVHEATVADYIRRRNYKSRAEVSPGLLKMATVPDGSDVFLNPAGWAPCIRVDHAGSAIFLMPGPPKEVQAIFQHHLEGYLSKQFSTVTATRRVRTEMYESEVSPHIQRVMAECPGTYLKAYVALRSPEENLMPLDIVAHGKDESEAKENLEKAARRLEQLVQGAGKRFVMGQAEP